MSYYEYILTANLTPEFEDKSKLLIEEINKYYVPYHIHKFVDEEIGEDKKQRTIIINSHTNIKDYLISRGFSERSIVELKIGYIPDEFRKDIETRLGRDSGLYVSGKAVLGNRISFPYIVDSQIIDIRGRALDKADPVRYKSPIGSAQLRGADYPYNHKDSHTDHIITEGEIKAAIASQHGIPCVAVPGIVSWRPKLHGTAKQTIVFDSTSSRQTREITYRAIDKLSRKLYNPHVAALPLRGNDKMDIDTFILAYGAEEFRTIVNSALPYEDWAKIQRRANVH